MFKLYLGVCHHAVRRIKIFSKKISASFFRVERIHKLNYKQQLRWEKFYPFTKIAP